MTKQEIVKTSTPSCGPVRYPKPQDEQRKPGIASDGTLTIGTFGWWEIITPNESNVKNQCCALAERKIAICFVTWLATAPIVELLDGRLGYVLVSQMNGAVASASMLVAAPWTHHITTVEQETVGPRLVAGKGIDGTLYVGIYAPHVGMLNSQEHDEWYARALGTVRRLVVSTRANKTC